MDITITPANVLASSTRYIKRDRAAGEALVAGKVAYFDVATNSLKLSGNNVVAKQVQDCIVLSGAGVGQPVAYTRYDPALDLGDTELDPGTLLAVSAAGAISPYADVGEGDWVVVFGMVNDDGTVHVDFERALRSESAIPVP